MFGVGGGVDIHMADPDGESVANGDLRDSAVAPWVAIYRVLCIADGTVINAGRSAALAFTLLSEIDAE